MSNKYSELWRKCQLLLMEALGILPAAIMLCAGVAPELVGYAWLFAAGYMVVAVPMLLVPGKLRLLYGIVACAALLAPCGLLLTGLTRIVALACAGCYSLILLLSLPIAGWTPEEELHPFVIGILVADHLVGQFVWYIDSGSLVSSMAPAQGAIMVSFFVFLLLVMLSANRRCMTSIGNQRQGVTKGMRRKQVLMTMGLLAIPMLFALIPSMLSVLSAVIRWISAVIEFLRELFAQEEAPPDDIVFETEPPFPTTEAPGELPPWVNEVAYYLCVAVGVPAIIVLLYKTVKRYARNIRNAIKGLGRFITSTTEDYEEEIIDIRDEVRPERLERRRRKRNAGPEPKISTPVAFVRYRYLRLKLKHTDWKTGSTARENLPESLAGVYERARYSDHPVTEEEAARFKAESKNI